MKVILFSLFTCLSTLSQADIFVVNDTGDVDQCDQSVCTLRGAIKDAMRTLGADTINFDIPADAVNQNYISGGSGNNAFFYWIIQPAQELPEILGITIDGTSADASPLGNPSIVIDGSIAGTGTNQDPMDGLTLRGNNTVKGIGFIYWDEAGLRILSGSDNFVTQSWFGLNIPYGLAAAPNHVGISYEANGSNVLSGSLGVSSNVISGNTNYGIETMSGSSGLRIYGALIGTDPDGEIAVPNDSLGLLISGLNHRIGNISVPLSGNVISGNISNGIQIIGFPHDTDSGHVIEGNIIGLNRLADAAIPNQVGIYVQRGQGFTIQNNVIAGNSWYGINVSDEPKDILVTNNRIGVNFSGQPFSTGTGVKANGGATDLVVGPDNIIAHGNIGVSVGQQSTGSVSVRQNQIHDNFRIGIDLEVDGVTANDIGDFDAGPNRLQNYPDITAAQYDSNGNRISLEVTVDSHPGASDYPITVDIYQADSDGEEGQTWLATTTFTESHYSTGLPINRSLTADAPVNQGDLIVTTATDAAGRTSEFSPSFQLAGNADFSISCDTTTFTTTTTMTCTINCQADSINGWGEEPVLSCENPDSQCVFLPSDTISFTQSTVPFTIEMSHQATTPGQYATEVTATTQLQGGPVVRTEILDIKQLSVSDYLFKDGFEGIVCQ